MTKEYPNLPKGMIPLGQKGNEERDKKVREKCRGSASSKRKISQQINAFKRRKNENKKIDEHVFSLITDANASAEQITKFANSILDDENLKPNEKINLLKALSDKHRTFFGNKIEFNGKVELEVMIKRWREERHCIIASAEMLIAKAKCHKLKIWEEKFGSDAAREMIKCLAEFVDGTNIEKEYKKMLNTRRTINEKMRKGEEDDN